MKKNNKERDQQFDDDDDDYNNRSDNWNGEDWTGVVDDDNLYEEREEVKPKPKQVIILEKPIEVQSQIESSPPQAKRMESAADESEESESGSSESLAW